MAIETTRWDVTDHLDSEERIAAYLEAAIEDGDAQLLIHAKADIAKARQRHGLGALRQGE